MTWADAGQDRNIIEGQYPTFSRWYLKGAPRRVQMDTGTMVVLKRAVEFFATV